MSPAVSAGTSSDEDTPFLKEMCRLTNCVVHERINVVSVELQFSQPFKNITLSAKRVTANLTSISTPDQKSASYKQ